MTPEDVLEMVLTYQGPGSQHAFEASFSNTASAIAEHVAATADTSAKIHIGMVVKRILDRVVQNK